MIDKPHVVLLFTGFLNSLLIPTYMCPLLVSLATKVTIAGNLLIKLLTTILTEHRCAYLIILADTVLAPWRFNVDLKAKEIICFIKIAGCQFVNLQY
jgi:hypothetical protein